MLVVRSVLAGGEGGTRQALFAGAVVALAMWLPRVAIDGWMEYRHEPRFDGAATLPLDRFLRVSVVGTAGVLALGAIGAAFVHRSASATPWWPLLLLVGGAAVIMVFGPIGVRFAHRSTPLDPALEAELSLVAAAGGVREVAWGRLEATVESGINAVSIRGLGGSRVLCTEALLRAEPELRNFVVAHEIGHLRRGHHRRALVTSLLGLALEIGALWMVDRWLLQGLDDDLLEVRSAAGGVADPCNWPLAVGVMVLAAIAVGLFEAWLSRSHERAADLDAMASVGVPDLAAIRSLHEHDRSDLAPGLLARLFAPHPSPAERLMRAERKASAG